MQVRVLFFGRLKEIVGRSEEIAELNDGSRVEDLFSRYGQQYPELNRFRGSVVASVNQMLADWPATLRPNDEVAFLPPVSGGTSSSPKATAPECALTREPIRTAEIVADLKAPEDGALVVFEGIVRNHSSGRGTLYLEYEAYERMALEKMKEIAEALRGQFPIDRLAMVHRLGRIEIGETSVLIAVSSAHRAAAFQACRFGIDTLKRSVPIWKKEYFEDGAVWAQGQELGAVPGAPSNSRPPESMG